MAATVKKQRELDERAGVFIVNPRINFAPNIS
jgi:hypothetical protein